MHISPSVIITLAVRNLSAWLCGVFSLNLSWWHVVVPLQKSPHDHPGKYGCRTSYLYLILWKRRLCIRNIATHPHVHRVSFIYVRYIFSAQEILNYNFLNYPNLHAWFGCRGFTWRRHVNCGGWSRLVGLQSSHTSARLFKVPRQSVPTDTRNVLWWSRNNLSMKTRSATILALRPIGMHRLIGNCWCTDLILGFHSVIDVIWCTIFANILCQNMSRKKTDGVGMFLCYYIFLVVFAFQHHSGMLLLPRQNVSELTYF